MEKIKLVIWDLDETFWKGTLSEGGVSIIQENVEIVKILTSRGIINSISSKNDFDAARTKLIQAGIWDYFIFPVINWQPKGASVKNIIQDCQLRAPNVLFIDDNISNRKEVEHYNEGINTMSEKDIPHLLSLPELKGKDDSELSRLNQYKVLEKKAEARSTYSDNIAFLKDSHIKIRFIKNVKEHKERILELISRTNQLNFTKVRLDDQELSQLFDNTNLENVCIHVQDRFGDYGICGFYCFDRYSNHLKHLLFSCRILNLGIETYVYQKLNKPTIKIAPPIAGELNAEGSIDWIEEVDSFGNIKPTDNIKEKLRVLMLGGCDLEQMCHYVDSEHIEIIKEFNYPNKRGVAVHKEHTCYLMAMKNCSEEERKEIEALPFGDSNMFDSILYSDKYDVLVYSVLMNYTQEIFSSNSGRYDVAYGGYQNKEQAYNSLPMNQNEKEYFSSNYYFKGQQTPDEFRESLEWLYNNITKPIIFINGAEIPDFNPYEIGAYARHQKLNIVLDDFIKGHTDRCRLIDLRKIVQRREECKDNIRHYQRPIYISMAEQVMTLVQGDSVKVKTRTKVYQEAMARAKDLYREIYKIIQRK